MGKAWLGGLTLALLAAGCATTGGSPYRAPLAREVTLAGERLFPESLASDAAGNLYIGSNPGTIYRAIRGRQVANIWLVPDAHNGLQTVFGVLVDDARRWLWVCSNPAGPGQTGVATVKAFELSNRRMVRNLPFPADAGPAMCNDFTLDTNGDLYVSDTVGARILRWRAGGDALEYWGASEHFAAIDGISFGPGGALYANNIQRHQLLRVNRAGDGAFAGVDVLETTSPMNAPDGLRPLDARRMLQSEGTGGVITVLTFPEGGGPVQRDVIADGIDYASAVTLVDGWAYFTEGKLTFLFDPAKQNQDPGAFVVRRAMVPQ